ncbi:hypothetical protein [uncultured Rikenella sp.]|uniref:hypothetical protein n=1 Tax=uncultured Rikenella sp. TaxID=368003 RepID=UPI00261DB421|nr:hypothetical protein [uncultured Rikenella sp.]
MFIRAEAAGKAPCGRAPGNRYTTGALNDVGFGSCSWSSSTKGNRGWGLSFNVAWFYTSYADPRALGFQLRCLSE